MRSVLFLLPLAALAACATPQEQCISDATRNLRVINGLVNETRANITRGYALEQVQTVRTVPRMCTGETASGDSYTYRCDETETITSSRPVAIDLTAEQAKLTSLLDRQAQAQAASDAAVAQCRALYPAG